MINSEKCFANGKVLRTCQLLYSTGLDLEDWFGQVETEPKRQRFQPRPSSWPPAFPIFTFSLRGSDQGERAPETGGFH